MKFRRLDRLLKRMRFRIVVVDEAHHSAARTYRQVLSRLAFLPPMAADDNLAGLDLERAVESDVQAMEQALKGWDRIAPRDQLLVGVTATPNRSDAVGLGCVYQSIVYSYALKDAIRDGWLVPITTWCVETVTSLDSVRTRGEEFVTTDLSRAVNTPDRNKLALAAWREQAEGRPTIVFAVDVAHAHALADVWTEGGFRAAAISGKTPKEERRRTLLAVREGRLDAVMNCMVLTEGTDLPNVSCIVHAAPTKSATLYEQKTGRGLRPLPGDPPRCRCWAWRPSSSTRTAR
jgi:ATP-dependent helicase IRC3